MSTVSSSLANGTQPDGDSPGDDLSASSLAYLEDQYARYAADPDSVDAETRSLFRQLDGEQPAAEVVDRPFPRRSVFNPPGGGSGAPKFAAPPTAVFESQPDGTDEAGLQEKLDQLIRNYRVRGHILAQIDPLGTRRPAPPELDPHYYGFTDADRDRPIRADYFGGPELTTLGELVDWLRQTYCRSIGVQFMHIDSLRVRQWLQSRMERTANRLSVGREQQLRILKRLAQGVIFEEFIQKKFQGAKSFSLEGAETLIPLLDIAIDKLGDDGVREIVLGMAHRGRLNVLANIMKKDPQDIFREFEDKDPGRYLGRGDVKYHLGHSHDWHTLAGSPVHLSMCFNPSHLEFVNTVAIGRMRAKQDVYHDQDRDKGCTILIHGDAAFIGEGIVQETLNLSELPGYTVGGTLHIIVNNQIGFTTSPDSSRSCEYATDVAKMLQIPIFHVNGEDPEAVAQALTLALDFRREFKRDVVIDMYCFRKRGHNESDEPSYTQPMMYDIIKKRRPIFEAYRDRLIQTEEISAADADQIVQEQTEKLEHELSAARSDVAKRPDEKASRLWSDYRGGPANAADEPDTSLTTERGSEILKRLCEVPEGFTPHKSLKRQLTQRLDVAAGKRDANWADAEAIAFASIVDEGHPIRMSGQDVERGTFSHRHAVWHDRKTGHTTLPISRFATDESDIEIVNSPLSEAGVLGFEYGYSLDRPAGLTIWEAQFGDFVNAAQVIIDQFISSAEDKWSRLSALVMLLPHGFEGQGPEHSSARLERFLQLAAEDNLIITQPSTPAQYCHMLRRQVLRQWKKPLVVMTPKSLLRLPAAGNTLTEVCETTFRKVIGDDTVDPAGVRRVLLCSGRVYYDLAAHRKETGRTDIAIVRMEELYPMPLNDLQAALKGYGKGTEVVWVQDEPENMGAWTYLRMAFGSLMVGQFPFSNVSRTASASPASGSGAAHRMEQELLISQAFDLDEVRSEVA